MTRLREIRKQRGLPQDVVARLAGVSHRSLWLWERYGILPRRETALRIAQVLGVSLRELDYPVEPQREGVMR